MMHTLCKGIRSLNSYPKSIHRYFSNFIVLGDNAIFNTLKDSSEKKIFYFTAIWCPPCKQISPIFESQSKLFPDIKFVKIDVDNFGEEASNYRISSIPTFIFVNGKNTIAQVVGADQSKLIENINTLQKA